MKKSPVITLLTDFGQRDGYVASMKGVILSLCPKARLIDITHEIAPQDIRSAAFVLKSTIPFFPEDSIHVCVVDPGVGTDRRAIAVKAGSALLIGPDNGVFAPALKGCGAPEARSLENSDFFRSSVSSTFHGRDIFAPVAAHLGAGAPFASLGPLCAPFMASWASPRQIGRSLQGEVIHIDRFGNAITNITDEDLARFARPERCSAEIGGRADIPFVKTYGSEERGAVLALIGSGGHLEIAINCGSAAVEMGLAAGCPVVVSER